MSTVTVKLDSDNGTTTIDVPAPTPGSDLIEWWQTAVFPETSGNYCEAAIVAGPNHLVGQTFGWEDS